MLMTLSFLMFCYNSMPVAELAKGVDVFQRKTVTRITPVLVVSLRKNISLLNFTYTRYLSCIFFYFDRKLSKN